MLVTSAFRKSATIYSTTIDLKGECIAVAGSASKKEQAVTIARPDDLSCSIRPWTQDNQVV